ncbi:HAMP domain-containing sensor histidine kinase [Sphingomonas sp. TREG-RG-20F-R18-01]|uniref:sensor histidine kinase n=1 Tax=Sphingomonas sp. TREG-RG-20F-R18-01 TaxID=2914982 RepID=UPI001F597FB8|nr:HAMP domain-containing sensor histidine kinase [Sphingomonas sp. TREG-RG-20F-R18-01]
MTALARRASVVALPGSLSRSWPLFLRIFATMLVTVLFVQVLNFGAFVLMPPPSPVIFTSSRIATVARTGRDASHLLTIHATGAPRAAAENPRDLALARSIASDLRLPAASVLVESGQHKGPTIIGVFRPPLPMGMGGPRQHRAMDDALFGDFTVSIRRPDGTWLMVEPVERLLSPWRMRFVLWFVLAAVAIAPLAWGVSRRIAKPIALFAAAADRLGRDPRAEPLTLTGPSEIAEAAAAFNQMQERLNRYVEDRTTLIAAVAHDLRTPLMRLSLRLEKAPDDLRLAGEEDIREMSDRIGAAMAFVREMTRHVRRQRLDLRSLAESVVSDASDAGGDVMLHAGPSIVMEGDAPSLKALLTNLVSNAVKYAGNAEVTLRSERGVAIIEVADTGPGMLPSDLVRAFEPFFRAERSRSRDTGGTGLGLASVRAVARAHGGDATIASRPGGGLLARVTLPV